MKKLLPLVLLFVGIGAGVGAGIFLRPDAVVEAAEVSEPTDDEKTDKEAKNSADSSDEHDPSKADGDPHTNDYARLNNQFVVPIVLDDTVTALVVLALSIEVPQGKTDAVYLREPKLRDSFLQVLFDHANAGGFEGNFTEASALGRLRRALKEVAQRDLGKELIQDVLILEIARQDY